jgi:hypothetical protein
VLSKLLDVVAARGGCTVGPFHLTGAVVGASASR